MFDYRWEVHLMFAFIFSTGDCAMSVDLFVSSTRNLEFEKKPMQSLAASDHGVGPTGGSRIFYIINYGNSSPNLI